MIGLVDLLRCWSGRQQCLVQSGSKCDSASDAASHMADNDKIRSDGSVRIEDVSVGCQREVHDAVRVPEVRGLIEINKRRVGFISDRRNYLVGFRGHVGSLLIKEPGA